MYVIMNAVAISIINILRCTDAALLMIIPRGPREPTAVMYTSSISIRDVFRPTFIRWSRRTVIWTIGIVLAVVTLPITTITSYRRAVSRAIRVILAAITYTIATSAITSPTIFQGGSTIIRAIIIIFIAIAYTITTNTSYLLNTCTVITCITVLSWVTDAIIITNNIKAAWHKRGGNCIGRFTAISATYCSCH
jgi:hypothetical protein